MNWLLDLDQNIFLKINRDWTSTGADRFFVYLTDFNKTSEFMFVVLPLILLTILYFQKVRGLVNLLFLAIGLGLSDFLSGNLLKNLVERPRPGPAGLSIILRAPAASWSFPSAHATNIFFVAIFLSAHFPKGRWLFIGLAVLVCYSRSYVGVHYPLDWICGAIFGGSLGYLVYQLQTVLTKLFLSKNKVNA